MERLEPTNKLVIESDVIVRYESKLDTCFIYKASTRRILWSNKKGYEILKRMRRPISIEELLKELPPSVDVQETLEFIGNLLSTSIIRVTE